MRNEWEQRKSHRLRHSNWLWLTEGAILATELREATADAVVAGAVAAAVVDADLAVTLLAQDGADGEPVVAVVEDADEPLARCQKLEALVRKFNIVLYPDLGCCFNLVQNSYVYLVSVQ